MAQITAQELASELGATPREVRKFLRSVTPKDGQPGKGARWTIEKKDLRSLRSKYDKYTADKAAAAEAEEVEEAAE